MTEYRLAPKRNGHELAEAARLEALFAVGGDGNEQECEILQCRKAALWIVEWRCGCEIRYCDYHKARVVVQNMQIKWRCPHHSPPVKTEIKRIRPIGLP
jgi:hypothetical protein